MAKRFSRFLRIAALTLALAAYGLAAPPGAAAQEQASDAGDAPAYPAELGDPAIGPDALTFLLVPPTRDELQALAERWQEIVKEKTAEVAAVQVALLQAEGSAEAEQRRRLHALIEQRKELFDKYGMVVDAFEKKGGDEALVNGFRSYSRAVAVETKRTADFETLVTEATAWVTSRDGGVQLAISIGIVVAALLALLLVARVVKGFAGRGVRHIPNISHLLQAFLIAMIYWVVVAIGLMVVLSALGVDISPVFALIGGASFILAFAFQDTLGNFASGLMIMINRPFDEGDFVDIGGVAGTVKGVSIVATTVATPDNQLIVIPNKNVWGNTITNVTSNATRRVDMVFGISYEDSIADALQVMERIVAAHPLVLPDPKPVIQVSELADSSVNFICRPWAKTPDYWTVFWDVTRQMKEGFDAAGISIPYPQRDVHIKDGQDDSAPSAAAS